jgi:hypothetical protein
MPHTVADLVADPAVLQGIAARCAADRQAAAADADCGKARQAMEQIAAEEDARHAGERDQEFARHREQRRAQEEQQRRVAEQAHPAFDPYSTPVTADPPAAANP